MSIIKGEVRDIKGYEVSDDYERLFRMAQVGTVVCMVDYGQLRDVAHTVFSKGVYLIATEAFIFVYARNSRQFVKKCQKLNVRWLVPPAHSELLEAAGLLMELLRGNVGNNDDWPIEIKAANDELGKQVAASLAANLTRLEEAVKVIRNLGMP